MDPSVVLEQIDRILNSQSFANKAQLRKLLEVLYKNMDSQTSLKPDQVIQELWPGEIRTKRSADVATEMNRLRHALEAYYDEEGKSDPFTIFLPNRSAASANGTHEKRWIDAKPREADPELAANPLPSQQVNSRRGLKRIVLIIAAAAALGFLAYTSFRLLRVPDQPKLSRLDGSALVIMNAEGKELWRKTFPHGFGPDSYYAQGVGSRVWFADLDGKGHTNVLFSYVQKPDAQPHSSTLLCYSDRGNEKWRWTPGRVLPEVGEPATYKTLSLGLLKATQKRPPRIVVMSDHDPWWGGPSQIAILDSTGKTKSEYWHSGGFRDMVVAEPDGGGGEEIIAAGVAHGYDSQATLVVLDPDRVSGASKEVVPEFQIHGMEAAHEKLRLLFQRSDLNRGCCQYNVGIDPTFQQGKLQLALQECAAPLGCPVRYEFDRDLHLVAVYPEGDEFRSTHDRFYQNGKGAHAFSAEEQVTFLKVRCLVGCKSEFVPVAERYQPAASFERGWTSRRNPNGVWSYGYSSGFTNPITIYDKAVQNGINGPNAQYWLSSSPDTVGTSPAAEYNNGPAMNDGNIGFLPNEFLLVAGIRGQYSDLIFTAPAEAEYSIAGDFRGAQYGVGTVVGIVAGGKVLFSSRVTSMDEHVPFQITLPLQAGNTVVFSVGPGGGAQNTALSLTITRPCAPTDRPTSTATGEITCLERPTGE
ncbi:MAG TPA: hypothetical protein VI431_08360 [Candidatus Acidoferrum sp.]